MLQRAAGADREPVGGPAVQLPDELGALRDPRRAEGVTLGNEAAGRVDHAGPAEGDVPPADHLVGFPPLRQAQGVERDELVGREAVVELADADVGRGDAGFSQRGARRVRGHVGTDQGDGGPVEEARGVGGEGLAGDENGVLEEEKVRSSLQEGGRDDNGGRRAIGGGAALQFGEGWVDQRGGVDFGNRVRGAELGVGFVGRVQVVDARDFSEIGRERAVSGGSTKYQAKTVQRRGEGQATSPCTPAPHSRTSAPQQAHW